MSKDDTENVIPVQQLPVTGSSRVPPTFVDLALVRRLLAEEIEVNETSENLGPPLVRLSSLIHHLYLISDVDTFHLVLISFFLFFVVVDRQLFCV